MKTLSRRMPVSSHSRRGSPRSDAGDARRPGHADSRRPLRGAALGLAVAVEIASVIGFAVALAGCAGRSSPALGSSASPLIPRVTVDADAATSAGRRLSDWIQALDSPRRWTADPSAESRPAISPNGRALAYVSDRLGSDDISILPLPPDDPEPPRILVDSPARDSAPRFSPDGKSIVYISTIEDAFGDVWIANVRNGKTRRLTDRATRDSDPVWMPDGKSILFGGAEGEDPARILQVNVKSGDVAPFKASVGGDDLPAGTQPDVSPDGRWIAFIRQDEQRLVLLDTLTGRLATPTPGDVPEAGPRFTSDGRSILVTRAADDTNADDRHDNDDNWTVWQLDFADADGSARAFFPLTTARYNARQVAPFPGGFFFASSTDARADDIFSFGAEGAIGLARIAPEEFAGVEALALQRPNDEDLLLCAWRQIFGGRVEGMPANLRARAAFEEVRLLERLGRLGEADRRAAAALQAVESTGPARGLLRVEQERIQVSRIERTTAQDLLLDQARVHALEALEALRAEQNDQPRVVAEALLLEATLHGDRSDLDDAVEATDDLLENFTQFPAIIAQALLLRGRMQEQLGLPDEIAQSYRRILRDFSDERREALEAARRIVDLTASTSDDSEQQRRLLNELIADPATPPLLAAVAQNRIGDLFVAEDRFADALDAYRATVRRYADQTEAAAASHFAQSRVLFDQGRFGESVQVYEQIERRLRPRNDNFYYQARKGFIRQTLLKGEAEWRLRDPYLARSTFLSLLRYDPSIVEAWRGILRSDNAIGRVAATLREIETGLKAAPDNPALRYARGLALTYIDGREKESMRELARASLLDPASPYPHQTLGYLYEQRMIRDGDRANAQRALQEYQLALALTDPELVPYNAAALTVNAGNAARLLGLSGLAQTYYARRALNPEPHEDPRTEFLFWRHAAESAFGAGDSAAAADFYDKALQILPEARERDMANAIMPPASSESDPAAMVPGAKKEKGNDEPEADGAKPAPDDGDAAEAVSASGVDWAVQETELIDRRALARQELGLYREAADGFAIVADRAADPRARALARRNVGVNLYLAARDLRGPERTELLRQAWDAFRESKDSVEKEGVITAKERSKGGGGLLGFAAVVGMGNDSSGAGLGFDQSGELRLLDGFIGWIAEADGDPAAALDALHAQIAGLPKLDDANKAYVLTQKAVLLSRVADLEERRGDLAAAARATLDSLAACRWVVGELETTNARGAAVAAMNLSRLWLLDPESIPADATESWILIPAAVRMSPANKNKKAGSEPQPDARSDVRADAIARILLNARSMLQVSPAPPAAGLLPDLAFHQGLLALRRAETSLDSQPDAADPVSLLQQSAEGLRHAQAARSFFAQVQGILADPKAGALYGVPRVPEDRERWRRLHAASILQESRALALLGRNRAAEETADRGVALARAWRYDDLLFAYSVETGLSESDPDARNTLWTVAAEAAEQTLPGQRSTAALARAARASIGAHFAARAAAEADWEEAWRWSEWAAAQNLAADMDRLDPELGSGKAARLAVELRQLRQDLRTTLRDARRSPVPFGPAAPSDLARNLETLETRWKTLLDTARGEAPEVWTLYSGQPLTVGDVIDFLDAQTALVRVAWLETEAMVISVKSDGLTGSLVADPENRLRNALASGNTAGLPAAPPDLESLARALFDPIRSALDSVQSLQIEADAVFLPVSFETLPLAGTEPAFERWAITRVPSLAHRYLAETRRVPWRQRLLTIGPTSGPATGSTALPYAWQQSLPGSVTGEEAVAMGRDANLIWTGWTLALDGRDPAATRFRPASGIAAPGAAIQVEQLFPANWSVSCLGVETRSFPTQANLVERFDALDLLLTGLTWGGCPSLVLGSTPRVGVGSETDSRVWTAFWTNMAEQSPAVALQNALKSARAAGSIPSELAAYRLWGHAGLSQEGAKSYAADEFQDRLGRAIDAHKRQDWPAAVRAFQECLFLQDQIDAFDPQAAQIAQILADDANQAREYGTGVKAAERLIELREAFEAGPADLAAAYRLKGLLLSKDGRPAPAAEAMEKALEFNRKADDPLGILNATVELAIVLENGDQYAKALEVYRDAQRQCAEAEVYEEEAAQWRRIGRILLLRLERWDEAFDSFNQALRLYTDLQDPRGQAESLLDLGQVDERRAAFDRALESYGKAEIIARQLDDKTLLARTALNQSNTYWLTANYLDCLKTVESASALAVEVANQPIELAAHNTAGLLRWSLNDYDRALGEFDQALALSRSNSLPAEEASTLNNIGLVWRSRADYPKALQTFGSALELDRRTGSRWGQAYDHRNIGMTHLMADNLPSAKEYLQEAIRLSESLGARTNYVKAVLSLADTDRKLGILDDAQKGYEAALSESRLRGIREVEWRSLQGQALVALERNDRPAAIDLLNQAISLVEQMRASIRVEELQDGFLADKQGLYEQMILLLLDEGRTEDSFEYAERARARNFIDLLGNQRISLNNAADQSLIERDRELHSRIARFEADLASVETDEQRQALVAQIQSARNELGDLLVEIRAQNPALSAFVTVDPISLKELYELLGDGVSLVAYFVAEKETVIWVVRDGSVRAVRVPQDRALLIDLVTTYRRKIQGIEDVADLSRTVYNRLLGPVESLIRGSHVLAVVPHNSLHYLSFASLTDAEGNDLIDRYALYYLPSASVFRYTHGRRRPDAGSRVLAIGNPDLNNPALALPFAEKEAERLVWAFPGRVDVLTGAKATERWVREHIADYGIIHIASHGEFDSVNPLFSAVELAADPQEDGRLTVREVFSLTINADLVTLSACQSGLAKVNNGDDLVGLNRAFVYAGTHALLSSLWRVDDVATAVLVKHFYRGYEETDKAEALRRAQVQVRKYNPHPAYWAGMVLTGDWK